MWSRRKNAPQEENFKAQSKPIDQPRKLNKATMIPRVNPRQKPNAMNKRNPISINTDEILGL